MKNINYFEKKLKSASTFLNRWQNTEAKIWDYQRSITNITIRLEKKGVTGNLHIICIDPQRINSQFGWETNKIIIEVIQNALINITDSEKKFSIICYDFEIAENVKPIYDIGSF